MRLHELASEWELEEIRDELRHGNAPDIVAFRHSLPVKPVRDYAKTIGSKYERQTRDKWTDVELAFVRDNYPSHDSTWDGWKILKRTWEAIRVKANKMGVKRRNVKTNEEWRKSNEVILGYKSRSKKRKALRRSGVK